MKKGGSNLIHEDTIKLLRECSAGVRMGLSALDGVLEKKPSPEISPVLQRARRSHEVLGDEIDDALRRFGDEEKNPHPVAAFSSRMKTELRLAAGSDDAAVADLLTDGGNMGVKSLNRYLNRYQAADADSRAIARRLSDLEEAMVRDLRAFL